ncbi:MAG: ATP-dependent zinc metalloprotease FtsH [Treponema sp.]|nr:ATP-dependent zinc metalloprotease FtsH [Treponema sp.]
MSEKKDDKENKKKDENDQFDFFKISADDDNKKDGSGGKPRIPFWLIIITAILVLGFINIFSSSANEKTIEFSEFRKLVLDGKIKEVELSDSYFYGYTSIQSESKNEERAPLPPFMQGGRSPDYKTVGILFEDFIKLLDETGVRYKFIRQQNNYLLQILLNVLLPIGLLMLMYLFIFRRMGGGAGGMGSLFGNGGGKAKAVDEGKVKTRFADVAGVDEAKEELVEVVDFLKTPKKYTDIGGKIPKGVLLVGPPGTGKTLLARAVAGEAGVPFFRISGSDFVEMFVGVGASRVRDLFRTAREKAPCIIFIDELDAIGKSRVNNLGGNDEREQTLNQLLVEMDGFDNEKGLIVLGATNRPDILDPALLRPGRFDRQVTVDKPDVKGREAILRIHAKNVKVDPGLDYQALAHATSGFSGADLANIVNEAALLAVRNGRKQVIMGDFDEAIEKVIIGLKKKSRVEKDKERVCIAYHETGHALVSAFTPGSDPVHKITILPRGAGALGYTMYRSEDEQFLYTKQELLGKVDGLLGGRAAEEVVFGKDEITTGASNDISRATDIIKRMITDYGMSDKFKNMTLGKSGRGYGSSAEPELVREFSEETQKYVDNEIARIIEERYSYAVKLLKSKRDLLEVIAKRLLEIETMEGKEFQEIVEAQKRCEQLAIEDKKAKRGARKSSKAKKEEA